MMLARVADSLYWIGRYVERAEHVSRLCDIMLTATLDQNQDAVSVAHIALAAIGEDDDTPAHPIVFDTVRKLVFDREDEGSVITSLALGRENARQVRDQITTEMWERLNLLFLRLTGPDAEAAFAQHSSTLLHDIIADLLLFKGATDATMNHGQGWRFLLLGVYLERAQLIARLLDVCFGDEHGKPLLAGHLTQMAVLRMACALEPYVRVYSAELDPRHLLEFLMFDEEFPRSIRFSTLRIAEHLASLARHTVLPSHSSPERLAARLSARLEFADLDETPDAGPLLAAVVAECSRIHHAVYGTFVTYPLEQLLPA